MRRRPRSATAAWLAAFAAALASNGAAGDSVLLDAMQAELARSMAVLGSQPVPPYFLSYEVTERERLSVGAAFGALRHGSRSRRRSLDVEVRLGDYALDNTRQLRDNSSRIRRFGAVAVPLDDDADAIRSKIWRETDRRYKEALERFTKVRTDIEVKVDAEDAADDFSREAPLEALAAPARLDASQEEWEARLERYTALFAGADGRIHGGSATLEAVAETRHLASSEGTRLRTGETRYHLSISAHTIADDGMRLPRHEAFSAATPAGLPDDETVLATVARMIADLGALRDAPLVEPYAGPAILEGRAAGVFFHEVLGHRVEGHRFKRIDDGQTFKKKVGEAILPPGFSVHFDPTMRSMAGADLAGAYRFDNQGVAARRVSVVEDGVLRGFLMSRSPIDGFARSNGHGRKNIGYRPVARQSNLIVEVQDPYSRAQLKARLLEAVAAQDKPFGLLFKDIRGGVTTTGRWLPNAFNVQPVMVYRVHPDGREELVRGVDLIGTPLAALSRVVAADDQVAVFNGTCGAESGGVPVAAVSPGILLAQIEVQKKPKSQHRPPLLPAPVPDKEMP